MTNNSATATTFDYDPDVRDPFFYVHNDPTGSWQRQDALIETIQLLDILQNFDSVSLLPAIISFIRADCLSRSLYTLGLREEALQLCIIAHDIIQSLWKSTPISTKPTSRSPC